MLEATANAPTPIHLATALFSEVASLTATPTDGVYADCLLSRAYSGLLVGLASADGASPAALAECAKAIEGCTWLTNTVRGHVGRTLRGASKGQVSPALAHQVVASAAQRTLHQMTTDVARSFGGDGAAYIAEVVGDLARAIMEKKQ